MKHSDNHEPVAPEITARQIRSIRKGDRTYFVLPVVNVVIAILFAFWHEWIYAAVFAAWALLYFPVSLRQYRNNKKMCEDVIQKYQQWHQEQNRS